MSREIEEIRAEGYAKGRAKGYAKEYAEEYPNLVVLDADLAAATKTAIFSGADCPSVKCRCFHGAGMAC